MSPETETTETVELAPEAADQIADKVADRMKAAEPKDDPLAALKAELADLKLQLAKPERTDPQPNRTVLEEGGVKAKPGDAVYYGGDDKFTYLTGDTDEDRAVNLALTQVMLRQNKRDLSARAKQVMVEAGERALKAGPSVQSITDPYIKSGYASRHAEARQKAITSTGAGAVDEWVPTLMSSALWRDTHLETQVLPLIRRVEMPSNPFDLPTQTADATYYYASTENVAVTGSNLTSSKATLTARKIQADVTFSGEAEEDSIIAVAQATRADLVRRGAQTMDDLVVHGDTETGATGNVNSDNGAPAAGSFYLSMNGLRKFAVVTNSGQTSNVAGAPTAANLNTIRGLLGKYGARPSDLAIVTGVSTYYAMLTIGEVLTQEKYGSGATILRGELARIFNIPIFLSEAIPGGTWDKVEADGKSNTTAGTLGWLVLFNRNHWTCGFRREFNIESDRNIQTDSNILVASFRMALTSSGIATTHTASGRNITV